MNPTPTQNDTDWPAFMAQQDMRFDTLPQSWQEAPHFGNAMVGSMLYCQDGRLRLQVFRQDVQDHRDARYGWAAYSRPRFMIGYFQLDTVGTPTGCDWHKDLWNAQLTGTLTTDAGTITIHHFVHADDMAIVTALTPSEGEKELAWSWHPHPAETTRGGYPRTNADLGDYAKRYGERHRETIKLHTPNPEGRLEQRGSVHVWIQDLLAGGQYATAWAERTDGDTRTHTATIHHSHPDATAADDAVADVKRFVAATDEDRLETHRAWWHGYYRQSYVTLPDKAIERLYWQTVYRLGCTSRTGRCYIDTSGLWFQGGPWAYTTHDWNTQAAHWGVYAANRLEQGREFVDRLGRYQHHLIEAVHPQPWRADCAYLPLATAGDLVGEREGDMRYYDLLGCLPWVLHNAWWQYRHSMDDQLLRGTVFPLLSRAVNLCLRYTEEGDDGRIHLQPTYSPETGVYRDANFDLALLKWSCHTLLHACDRLGIDDELIPRWRDVIDRLVDFPTDEQSFMLAGDEPAPEYHRHLSHLLMIYPLYLVNTDQPGTETVLSHAHQRVQTAVRGHGGGGNAPNQAMIQTHAAPIAAALGKGDEVLGGLRLQIDDLLPNGLWACAGNPCFESTVSLMNTVQAMLIQSWSDPANDLKENPGPIRVFPAVPEQWADTEFHDLRAEGAFLVSARRAAGQTAWVKIESLAGEPCRVMCDFEGEPRVAGEREHKIQPIAPGVYELDIERGEAVTLLNSA